MRNNNKYLCKRFPNEALIKGFNLYINLCQASTNNKKKNAMSRMEDAVLIKEYALNNKITTVYILMLYLVYSYCQLYEERMRLAMSCLHTNATSCMLLVINLTCKSILVSLFIIHESLYFCLQNSMKLL